MTARTSDFARTSRSGDKRRHEVGDGETIYAGTFVCIDATGYLVDGADTAGLKFAGIAYEGVDNSSGSDADEVTAVYVDREWQVTAQGLTETDVGKPLFLIDNNTVGLGDDSDVDNYVYVGRMTEYISATECWFQPDPYRELDAQPMTIEIAGAASGDLDLSTVAAEFGGSDIHVRSVQSIRAFVTATGAGAAKTLLEEGTDYSVASGAIACDTDQSANTLVINLIGFVL